MAKIVLSQRMEFKSDYKDLPFRKYHFPSKNYSNSIHSGDEFIYYQGKNGPYPDMRYYFGHGIVGKIYADPDDSRFMYADILDSEVFLKKVPIWSNGKSGAFLEDIGKQTERKNPPWQTSIRSISDEAFLEILKRGKSSKTFEYEKEIEKPVTDPKDTLRRLNDVYKSASPDRKKKLVNAVVDRGTAVSNALKALVGAKCQICDWEGFEKTKANRKGLERYIEAHHIDLVSNLTAGSLCSDNILLLCPNCHREIHFGSNVSTVVEGRRIHIKLSKIEKIIDPIVL